ncbi:MAG: lysophospholipase [Candidatus Hydrogenedentota bacterium]
MQNTTIAVDEGPFPTFDGLELYHRSWSPQGQATAAVIIVHGYGHHSGSFDETGRRLAAEGFAVLAYDQRGFGKAGGTRGNIVSFDTTLRDLDAFFAYSADVIGDLPLFLMGHSLGGLIGANYAITRQPIVNGLVFSSALLKLPDRVSPTLLKLSAVISTLLPFLPVERIDVTAISRDPSVIDRALNDPLCHYGPVNARTGDQIARAIRHAQEHFPLINAPIIAFHGTADRLTDPEGSRTLVAKAVVEDKTLLEFDGGYHELFNDLERESFFKAIIAWLLEHAQ